MPSTPEATCSPANNGVPLTVSNLRTYFFTSRGTVKAVDDVSFHLKKGECLCLVGESGCGKTVTALSLLRLFDSPPGAIVSGQACFHGEDLLRLPEEELRRIRGNKISMIFQDPQSSLNPVLRVGYQIEELIKVHRPVSDAEARARAVELMKAVGIPDAEKRSTDYPHQFSGGMKQRVMIAMALSCDPEILVADEPTTALDATIKANIIKIFKGLKESKNMSILFITHDFGVVAQIADRVTVMYAGKVAEAGTAEDIFYAPKHPYTVALINCLPDMSGGQGKLANIPGSPPSLVNPPSGCHFHPRCPKVMMDICPRVDPYETRISGEHVVFCHLYP
ncbi:MAG: ABC transporter ATP-binding protein [Chloroflexi bacterium]|nr:ABC transporter ATP-binding protein [Chloroflexota bacterium]